jgi:hypothetical protein
MRCEFAANTTGGIHVIPEFEVARLCLLEGSNGIGKTLAVRLLELATGRQPYVAAQAAWRSLKVGLGELNIRISELRNGDVLEVELTPSTWPDDPAEGPMTLGRAWHNGRAIDVRTIPSILRVTRIGGDENIITQFKRVITADAAVVGRQYRRLDAFIDQLNKIDAALLQDIQTVSRTEVHQLIARQEQAEERLASATQVYERQSAIVRTLDLVSRKQTALQQLQEQGPGIESRLAEIEAELGKLRSDISQLETRHAQHLPNAVREQKLLAEIEQLRSKQARQTEQLRVTATKLNDTLAELKLSNVNDIAAAQQETSIARDQQIHNRELLVAPPDLISLIRELRTRLEKVRGSSLDTAVVVNIGRRAVQAHELRDGLAQREEELARKEQQTFLAVIDTEIQSLDGRLRRLADAAKLQQELAQRQRTLDGIEHDLRTKTIELDTNRDAEYQRIAEDLQHRRQRELVLIGEQATLRYTKSVLEEHGTVDELVAEIASMRNDLFGTTETYEEANGNLDVCQIRLQEARKEHEQAIDALDDFKRKLEEVLTRLNQSPDYMWLRVAPADKLPTINDDRTMALDQLKRMEQAIRRFERAMNTLITHTGRLQDALERLAHNLINETSNRFSSAIITHYEQRFGMLLADPNVRQFLFDNGRFMRLNLQEQVVIWENAEGETCRRPLEAFSSGQRAFSYVLGSILQQRQVTAQNHLLVLDEFGAFIEAGRIEWLERFLQDKVLQEGGATAVIIILPLRKQLPSADDSQVDSSDRDTRMLIEHGYKWEEAEVLA